MTVHFTPAEQDTIVRLDPRPDYPATERQLAFIEKLAAERPTLVARADDSGVPALAGLVEAARAGRLSKRGASGLIDHLLSHPKEAAAPVKSAPVVAPKHAPVHPDIPAGRYAVEIEGVIKFYKVDRPTEGKWQGFTFLKVQASDDFYPVKGDSRATVLALISADCRAAAIRYGHELGQCAICGRVLTDEASRRAGIGPVCAAKAGW